jgi:hypothetical protein
MRVVGGRFEEEERVRFRGLNRDQAWRVAFWVLLIVATVASAGHGILG